MARAEAGRAAAKWARRGGSGAERAQRTEVPSRPELVAGWKEGRKELFHPCGKSYVETIREQDGMDSAPRDR
jgi:hypothetical protein